MSSSQQRRDQRFIEQPSLLFDDSPKPLSKHCGEGASARDENYNGRIRQELNERQQAILSIVVASGTRGVTLDEISEKTGRPCNAFSGRVTELEEAGLVSRLAGVRRQTRSGSTASVIVAIGFADFPPTTSEAKR